MRRVIVSSATSPSAGMSNEQIDGDEVLVGGSKCVENFCKFIPAFISKLKDQHFTVQRPRMLLNQLNHKSDIKNQRVQLTDYDTTSSKISEVIKSKLQGK